MFLYNFVSIILVSEYFTRTSWGATLPRKSSAVFYELPSKEGYKVEYKDGPIGWSNLSQLFPATGKNTRNPPQQLCITGVWLLYPHPGYKTSIDDKVYLISGQDKCLNPSELGTIGSLQPLASTDSSITLFTGSNFGSLAYTISEGESVKGGLKQVDEDVANVGSLVVTGGQPWSLLDSNGKVACIRPQSKGGASICYAMELTLVGDFHVNAVFPDCPEENDESVVANYELTNCKEFGSGKAEPMEANDLMGRRATMKCRYNISWSSEKFTEEETALITKLLTIRLTHDFEKTEQILWPDAREDIWKTSPLDTAFDIIIASVPENVVNTQFLMMVREFTVYHLNEIWKEKHESKSDLNSWRSHKVIEYLLNQCLEQTLKTNDRYKEIIKNSYNQRSTLEEFSSKTMSKLAMNKMYDPIIETAWVVSNYAMALCHNLFEYKINFWDNFVTTFTHLYFRPLEKRWKNPTVISPKTFGVILSGFGVEIQHQRVAFAASRMFDLTPKLEPFERDFTVEAVVT